MGTRLTFISGSPSPSSRTLRLLRHLADRFIARDFEVTLIDVRELPAEALLHAHATSPALATAFAAIESSAGVVVGTPIYKAAYSGVLKTFLDLLPAQALRGKVVWPLVTGGTPAHTLSLDYALKPVLAALGDPLVAGGLFIFDQHVGEAADGTTLLDPDVHRQIEASTLAFTRALGLAAA